jgi:hypothetical protein
MFQIRNIIATALRDLGANLLEAVSVAEAELFSGRPVEKGVI